MELHRKKAKHYDMDGSSVCRVDGIICGSPV